ncbi:MAG: Fic family protein [Bacilli bacterium]|nr:Fic family protein [Bacilli bacterium]
MTMYKPPFTITNRMLSLCISITEKVGQINNYQSLKRLPILRKNNRIKSIHSSLAIEANSLSINQVKDVIEGKIVIGPRKEIQEVKNAYNIYNMFDKFDCFNENDLLKAHEILTYLVDEESGKYRNHAEGVFDGDKVIFVAPPENMVPILMKDLFDWLKNDKETPLLIKSCVFHYEFVFIHPFGDGNGRTARLWQNLLLNNWNNIFEYIPLESQIYKYQSEYYNKIAICHKNGNSNEFIEFILLMLNEVLDEAIVNTQKESRHISEHVNKLLEVMEDDIPYSANELLMLLNIKSKETLRASYLNPALENGLIKMTLPEKPNSKNQRYIK